MKDVLAWARTKPADERYSYSDPGDCALCQFLAETGRAKCPRVVPGLWRDGMDSQRFFAFSDALEAALNSQQTFGALASRLEALLPAEPISTTWTKADAYLTDIERVSA